MRKPKQMIVVTVCGAKAHLSCYEHIKGRYTRVLGSVTAYVGKNGVTAHKKEGDGKTPLGIYPLCFAFGTADKVETKMPYRKIRPESKWCCESGHKLYNRWTHGEFKSCETLIDYSREYALACTVGYNYKHPVSGFGSAIVIHVSKTTTMGCVGVSAINMKKILFWLNPSKQPHIFIKEKLVNISG